MTAARSRVRPSGTSRRVAAGSATTSAVNPPIHTLAASTWTTFAGSSTATGACTPAWPPSPGRKAGASSGTARAAIHAPPLGSAAPAAPTVAGRMAGMAAGRTAVSTSTSAHARTPIPHTVPKRVWSTASISPSADHKLAPSAVAAWSPRAATPATAPTAAATSSTTRRRRAKAADAARQSSTPSPSATWTAARRPGSQTSSSSASAPIPTAIAAYSSARTAANAIRVAGPASWPASSWSTVAAGAAPEPTEKTKPPETGCESAETTR
jgi:hypothetical protein